MDDVEPTLTDADRRTIAEIRRKLDAEFRQKLDDEYGPLEEPARGTATERRGWHRGVLATVLVGVLAGTLVGAWVRYAGTHRTVSHTHVPAQTVEPVRILDTTQDVVPVTPPAVAPTPVAVSDAGALHDALEEWIEATRRGDIATQMRFYPARVAVYYTWRDVPRDAVHAEKLKVFGAASRLDITTDAPAVELAQDRRTAVTRFRKQYVIEGPALRRRGEVLQELRWARTDDGWRIVGERDARVLRSG